MSWSGLASNQMVSFTDAQGGGFTLQSGQSPVTSNQCMTKNDALTKYVLNSSYMSSYANNQLVPKSQWVAGIIGNAFIFGTIDSGSSAGACGGVNTGRTLYAAESSLAVGVKLYTDIGLTNGFIPGDGTSSYYLHSGSNSYRVTQYGIINLITTCVTSYPYDFSTTSSTSTGVACGLSYGQTLYSLDSILNTGSLLYTDAGLTSLFNGSSRCWHNYQTLSAIIIGTAGNIKLIQPC